MSACVSLLAACTLTPWQPLSRSSDDSNADDASAATEASAPGPASATPVIVPTSRVVAEVPATASKAAAAKDFYRVKTGDTLYHIAAAHGQRPADIVAWNKLPASGQVKVGQLLRVAPPVKSAAAPAPAPVPVKQASATPAAPVAPAAPEPAAKPRATTAPAPASRFVWPMNGSVATSFAPGKSRGIVIAGAPGEPVKAAAAGRVVYAGTGIQGYGKLIIVKHDARLVTAYGRNGRLLVKQGESVKQGQTIATSGADAAGVGTLLFEVREKGRPVDPLGKLPRAQS
ncbi:peptidoglycan DD-metalloendopeptidase family protein [Paraburkholderia sp. Ac-20340]|uniref:peptidoglycan DD-metalloendopeptidase family protein n=1 Tax=Paraburkholderia sp. Ac-20340 TaxID=2703888 RepID=UPI001F120C8A|nr:peptidoglycan DD-metalloendopeptidase family protein [Paraburkholderia sp. Ac-20340]